MPKARTASSGPSLRLGLFEVQGTKANNVILARHRGCHNFAPFRDTNPQAASEHQYKALGGTGAPGLIAFVSADGIHWQELQSEPVITQGAFDSQNVAFWSEVEQQYVCYFRIFVNGVRWIARATSSDFVHWSPTVQMTFGDRPPQHLYTNQTLAYFRAPHIYLGFPTRFFPGRRASHGTADRPARHAQRMELRQRLCGHRADFDARRRAT